MVTEIRLDLYSLTVNIFLGELHNSQCVLNTKRVPIVNMSLLLHFFFFYFELCSNLFIFRDSIYETDRLKTITFM